MVLEGEFANLDPSFGGSGFGVDEFGGLISLDVPAPVRAPTSGGIWSSLRSTAGSITSFLGSQISQVTDELQKRVPDIINAKIEAEKARAQESVDKFLNFNVSLPDPFVTGNNAQGPSLPTFSREQAPTSRFRPNINILGVGIAIVLVLFLFRGRQK